MDSVMELPDNIQPARAIDLADADLLDPLKGSCRCQVHGIDAGNDEHDHGKKKKEIDLTDNPFFFGISPPGKLYIWLEMNVFQRLN